MGWFGAEQDTLFLKNEHAARVRNLFEGDSLSSASPLRDAEAGNSRGP